MSTRELRARFWLLMAGAALVLVFPLSSEGKGKGKPHRAPPRPNKAVNQQALNSALQADAAANMAKGDAQQRLSSADQKIKAAKAEVDDADVEVKQAVQDLKALEKKIEDAESPGSPFHKAKAALDKAQGNYDQARDKVLGSPEYQAKCAAASGSDDPEQSPAMIRKRALDGNEDVQAAHAQLEAAKAQYAKARMELLNKHPEWADASQAVKDAKKRQADAAGKVGGGLLHKRVASRDLAKANAASAATHAVVQQTEAQAKDKGKDKKK